MRRLIAVLFLRAKNLNHLHVYYQPFLLRSSAIKGRNGAVVEIENFFQDGEKITYFYV